MKRIFFNKAAEVGGGAVSAKVLSAAEKELLYNYRAVLDRIKKQLVTLAEKINKGGILELAEMNKYNRLNNLMLFINTEISRLVKTNGKLAMGLAEKTLIDSYKSISYEINQAVNQGAGTVITYNFGLPDPTVITASVNNPLYFLAQQDIKASTLMQVQREITQGLIGGESYFSIAKRVKERMDISATRARTIVRTEAGKAFSEGHVQADEQAQELGIITHKMWVATLDDKTRKDHREMDGQEADEDGMFTYPDGIQTQAPRLAGEPADVINCRCRMVSIVEGFEPTQRMSRDINSSGKSGPMVDNQTYEEWNKTQKSA